MTDPQRARARQTILLELAKTPLVETACKKAGISRATFYRWRADDEDFEDNTDFALAQGRERINDLAESRLIQGLDRGELSYIRYWLNHNHHRYVQRKRVPLPYPHFSVRKVKLWRQHW